MAESVSYNRPSLNWISSGLALVGIGSVALGVYMVAKSDWGNTTHPVYSTWFLGGLVSIAVGIIGFGAVLLGWHLFAQREVRVRDAQIVVRRWLQGLLGRDGETVALDSQLSARFLVKGGGAKLAFERPGVSKSFSIWFWSLDDARRLAARLAQGGASVRWELPYPSDEGQT